MPRRGHQSMRDAAMWKASRAVTMGDRPAVSTSAAVVPQAGTGWARRHPAPGTRGGAAVTRGAVTALLTACLLAVPTRLAAQAPLPGGSPC